MSDSVKIVGTPYEDGQTKTSVRKAVRSAYPGYVVASILRDDEGARWLIRLVESADRVHHKLADDSDAPFPLKELGPKDDVGDDGDGEDSSDDDSDSEEEVNKDDDELKPDEKPAEDDKTDVKGELAGLVKQFKKLLPALEKVVGPIDEDEGPGDLDKLDEDVGPTPGNEGPLPPGGPPGGLPPGPPAGGPVPPPPRPPGIPGGRPKVPPRPGVPTFTHAQELPLQRTADVSEEEARAELREAYPEYNVRELTHVNGLYKVILEHKGETN
jgi:hypothetical protein